MISPKVTTAKRTSAKHRLNWKHERELWKRGVYRIVGVDEAGRGPLAGPVVAAAVVFEHETCLKFPKTLRGLNDSKQVAEEDRELFFEAILSSAMAYGIGIVSSGEIDRINILQATMMAMSLAVDQVATELARMELSPEVLLVDGNYFRTALPYEYKTIIDGDAQSPSIAAASILAKVTRDRIMRELHPLYPQYNFAQHKGYGTPEHIKAIDLHGFCPEHRRSFRREAYDQALLFSPELVAVGGNLPLPAVEAECAVVGQGA